MEAFILADKFKIKKSLEFDYPRLQGGTLRRIHGHRHRDFVIRLEENSDHSSPFTKRGILVKFS